MKRILTSLLAGTALLSLTSCGDLTYILIGSEKLFKPGTILIISLIIGLIVGWCIVSSEDNYDSLSLFGKVGYILLCSAIVALISYIVIWIFNELFTIVVQGGAIIAIIGLILISVIF